MEILYPYFYMKKISLICVFLFSIISASIAQCNFTISDNTPCVQSSVTFTVQNPGSGPYTWNFGDPTSGNNTASGLSTAHTFNTPGTYTVSLSNNGTPCPSQTVIVGGITPNASLSGLTLSNNVYSICNGTASFTTVLTTNNGVTNSSQAINYTINWGDGNSNTYTGSQLNNLGDNVNHTYNNFGFYTIGVTANNNGCSATQAITLYNGSNPSVGLANPGNTVGLCAPASLTFPITNTNNNPAGTTYTVTVNGQQVAQFPHPPPSSYTHNFSNTSCNQNTTVGSTVYPSAFDISITASNPCGQSSAAVAPIRLSSQPLPSFSYTPISGLCPNQTVTFTNTSTNINEVNPSSGACVTSLLPSWSISPPSSGGVNWTIASGSLNSSNTVGVTFLQPGTYTVTMTLPQTACPTQPVVQTIVIQTPPTALASFTTNPTNNCVPAVVTLNNTSTGTPTVNYTWSVPSGIGALFPNGSNTFSTTSTASTSVNFTQAGTYNITLTASNVCATATWTQPVTLKTVPFITLTPISNICSVPATISPSATYGNGGGTISSYNWNFTGGSPTSSTSQNPSPVNYTSSNAYTITATAINECGSTTATQSFTVTPVPSITLNPSSTSPICAGSSVTITASATGGTGLTYAWSNSAGNSASITVSPLFTTTYTVTVTNSAGCSATASQTVIVNPLPLATATNTGPYCLNNTISLNSSGGGTYSWSSPNGFTSSLQNPTISNATAINSGLYTVTVTLAGCTATASTSVIVNSNPVASITGNTPCVGGTLTLTPSGGTTYSWILPNGFTSTANPLVLNGVTAANAGVYSVTASNASGCTATGSTTVTINALPIPVATNTGPVCPNTSATLNGSGGGTYSWTGPNGFTSTTQNPSVTPGTTNATYSLTVTNSNSCTASISTTITVRTPPNAVAINTSPRCLGSTSAIVLNASGGTTYSWSGPNSYTSSTQNPSLTTPVASNQGGVYTVTVTDANTCTATAQTTVVVNPLPIVDAGLPQSICSSSSTYQLLGYSPTTGGTGVWTGTGVNSTGGFDASLAIGNYNLTYTFTDNNGCINSDVMVMTITSNQAANAGVDESICNNALPLALVGTPVGGTWSGTGVTGSSFSPIGLLPGTYTLIYTVNAGTVCQTVDTKIITVLPLPQITASSTGPYCVGGSFALSAVAANAQSYAWGGPNAFNSVISNPVLNNLTTTMSGIYTVTVTGANACSQTATTSITINPLPIILVSDTTYCNASGLVPLPYTSPANGSWAGSGISGLSFNPQIGVGTYNATYTYTDNNSCTDSVTVEISVITPISINAGANDTVCLDAGLFTLTNYSPSSGGNWSGAGIVNSSNGIFNPLLAGGGLHTLTYTYGAGNCQVTASKTIFVVDLSATTAGVDEAFCISRPIFNLTGNNPLGGVWSGDGITDVNLGTYDPMIAGAGLDTLSYTYTDVIFGCQWTDYKVINVYPLPTPSFDSLGAICINVPYTFNNSSPNITSSLWTFGDGGTSNLTSPTHTYSSTGNYTVSLIASNIYSCVDSVSRTIFVTEPPHAHFTMDTTEGCDPLPVVFTNQSYGYGASYLWDFGNGTVDTNYTPAPVVFSAWAQDTVYHITLTVSNLCGTVVWEDSVLVRAIPLVQFTPNVDDGCSPLFVSFTNTTRGNPDTYFWDMGNGFTTTNPIPPIQYYNTDTLPRIYTVTLISGNQCGFDTLQHDIVVSPVTVDAFFYADTTSGCEPLTVNFSNYSTPNTSMIWDFGDNNGSSLASPVHVFDSSGIFKVIQYVSNGCGYDSAFVYITVYPQPAIEFTHPAYVCAGEPMQFTNTSSSVIVSSWDFGDGTTSSDQNPSHIYANGGVYTVILIGTSLSNGCPAQISHNVLIRSNPVPIFTPSSTFGCPPLNITFNNTSQGGLFYTWDFGDGNTAVTPSPSHLYTVPGQYTVALEVTDNFGCKADTAMYNLFVYPIPSSSFTYAPVSLCGIPTTINFTNTSTGAIGYNWTFGNGANSILNNPTAIYTSADDFNVSLVATNQYLCSDTANAVITTYAQPQADFLLTPDSGCQPLVVSFSDNSIDANGWEWVFGDGNSSNLPNPVHTYIDEGTYNVTLIANYSNTCFDTILVSNAVEVLPTPVADFSYVEVLEPASGIINFTNESSPDANQFEWDFGDGDFSNEENPNHRYYINGNRAIMLTVMAENGCQDTIVKQITPTIFRGLFVPNAFSPEVGVGDVRVFWPKGVGLAYYHVKVYSPWGELLWQSDKLNEGMPSESWDGTYHGILMPQDVYVWECEAIFIDGSNWKGMPDKDGVYRKIGSVTLLR